MNTSANFFRFALLTCLLVLIFTPNIVFCQPDFTEYNVHESTIGAASIYCCYLDGDDRMDIIVAENEGSRVTWFRNEGGNPIQWTRFVIRTGMTAAHSVHANDFDNDGDMDVVATTYGSSIYWFRNEGGDPLEWTRFPITTSFSQAHEVYSADINGNGRIDVLGAASGANQIKVWYNSPGDTINWFEEMIDDNCLMAKSVHAADINNDGRMDILSAGIQDNDVYWYENNDDFPHTWTAHPIDLNFSSAHRVQGIDINHDGYTDVLGAGYLSNMVSWWKNNGDDPVTWSEQVIRYAFGHACVAQAVDIDGDSILDVVATAQEDSIVAWFHNDDADPITWAEHDLTTSFVRPWPLYACDIDDDGDNDILSASSYNGSDELKLWLNDGNGSFVEESFSFPSTFKIDVFPNPFNAQSTVTVHLPYASKLKLSLYDILGREIFQVANDFYSSGSHNLTIQSEGLTSGVYFIYCSYGDNEGIMKKITLIK